MKMIEKNLKIEKFVKDFLSNEKKFLGSILPWQKKLNFAFYSDDLDILNILKENLRDAQLIDSDIDYL